MGWIRVDPRLAMVVIAVVGGAVLLIGWNPEACSFSGRQLADSDAAPVTASMTKPRPRQHATADTANGNPDNPAAYGSTAASPSVGPFEPAEPAPPVPGEVVSRAASALHEALGGCDLDELPLLVAADDGTLRERLDWFRSELGKCRAPQPLIVHSPENVRYLVPCEHGDLETALRVANGRVRTWRTGARGLVAPPEVEAAAQRVMGLIAVWDDGVFHTTFSDQIEADATRVQLAEFRSEYGPCEIDDVDLASARGALYDLRCRGGNRTMKVDLGAEDRIASFLLIAPRETPR